MSRSDPIRARREQAGRLAEVGQRLGYFCFAIAIVAFVIGFATGFPRWTVPTATAGLVVGSILLAPAIVLGYAVKAAEREDRERGL